MYTTKELREFYLKNREAYPREAQNKLNYLFKILKSSFGDVGHQWEVVELLFNA